MQHLGVNFGGILRFNLVSLSVFVLLFLLKKYELIFKGPAATLPPTPQLAYAIAYAMWSNLDHMA